MPLKAHIVATRPGHAINAELTKALFAKLEERKEGRRRKRSPPPPKAVLATETSLDIRRVLDTLPHRYPVRDDRPRGRVQGRGRARRDQERHDQRAVFPGAFPGNPVMPGVLQLEAMAQAAGILMLRRAVPCEGKTALFMSATR
jgi:UDP-3-O-[3-hydroxymyristoyl] N-acetylglucosamine deacetylase/3-hydroxyacyl-[acyl-carrier-protein] dehydratase